jgi:hypothetical protein
MEQSIKDITEVVKEDPVRTDKSKPMVIGANGFPVLGA